MNCAHPTRTIGALAVLFLLPDMVRPAPWFAQGDSAWSRAVFQMDDDSNAQSNPISFLQEHGFTFSAMVRADIWYNASGGVRTGSAYLHNIDAAASIDGEQALGWAGASAFIHVMSNNGGSINRFVGDHQMNSNIEAPALTKVYELWIQQNMSGDAVSVLGGLYDLNTEFYVTSVSTVFLNGSFGIGKDFSQSGHNGPSVFPNTALSFRVRVLPWRTSYVQFAALDGVPGMLSDRRLPSFQFDTQDGMLLAAEFGSIVGTDCTDPAYGKAGLGAWRYTTSFDEILPAFDGSSVQSRANEGLYLLAEKNVLTLDSAGSRRVSVFLRYGIANSRINTYESNVGFGIACTGLFSHRPDDVAGIALTSAWPGSSYRDIMTQSGARTGAGETVLEGTYLLRLTPWFSFQPDIQYVFIPGSDSRIADALVMGARINVSL